MKSHVLVIEDSEVNLELVAYLLEARGYLVERATDGLQGLALARKHTPHLIICDIQLPRMDGFEFAQALRKEAALKDTPLVALTALALPEDRQRILAAGFDGYFSKPIDPVNFLPDLESYLGTGEAPPAPLITPQPDIAPTAANTANGPLILVVDNLQMNLDLATSLLTGSGYATMTARSMTEAMTLLLDRRPDMILSDVNMEQGTGNQFLAAVRGDPRWNEIPFVFITSSIVSPSFREEGLRNGANEVLFRPMEAGALLDAIKDCLDGQRLD